MNTLISSEKHKKDGWELSNIETCHEQKKKYKTQQAKLKVDVRTFLADNSDKVEIVWER